MLSQTCRTRDNVSVLSGRLLRGLRGLHEGNDCTALTLLPADLLAGDKPQPRGSPTRWASYRGTGPASAGVSVLSVKDFQVAGTGDCRMGRLLPTQAGDEPLASRSLRPRYISPLPTPRLQLRQEYMC